MLLLLKGRTGAALDLSAETPPAGVASDRQIRPAACMSHRVSFETAAEDTAPLCRTARPMGVWQTPRRRLVAAGSSVASVMIGLPLIVVPAASRPSTSARPTSQTHVLQKSGLSGLAAGAREAARVT
jgi:hypothetical protein